LENIKENRDLLLSKIKRVHKSSFYSINKIPKLVAVSKKQDDYKIDKAKELENKMKESQEKIKSIKVEGISGSNSVKVTLNGDGEMIGIFISEDIMKEDKSVIEDLIVAAHNNAKEKLKSKTSEEISKVTGGFGIPGFKWPL
jgi:DNA-binding YbaB/EbfC family protein